jgi:hypothetical protein
MGGTANGFRPDDPLTQGELADLVTGLTGKETPVLPDPATPATIGRLDAQLVRALGLLPVARQFAAGVRAAGLAPRSGFGTDIVARLLGLRVDHPAAQDVLELRSTDPATRAEAAYSAVRILGFTGSKPTTWEAGAGRLRLLGVRLAGLQAPGPRRCRLARGDAEGLFDLRDERRGQAGAVDPARAAPARRPPLLPRAGPRLEAGGDRPHGHLPRRRLARALLRAGGGRSRRSRPSGTRGGSRGRGGRSPRPGSVRRPPQSGMFPCFRGGRRSRFVRAVSSASISTGRVRRGSITSSTYPRSAATYGFAKRAL